MLPGRRLRQRGAAWTLTTLIILAPQLLGGVPGWSITVISGSAALILVAVATSIGARRRQILPRPWLYTVTAMLCLTTLQWCPLPTAIAQTLAPDAVYNLRRLHFLLGEAPPRFVSLSLAPGTTGNVLAQLLASTAVFLSSHWLCTVGYRRWIFRSIALAAVAMATVALIHRITGAQKLYGIYAPQFATPPLAPLLNPNHLAGLCAFALPLTLALRYHAQFWRPFWTTATFLLVVTTALSLSRGGMAALLLAGLTFMLAQSKHRSRTSRQDSQAPLTWWPWFASAVTVAAGLYAFGNAIFAEFQESNLSKLQLFDHALSIATDAPWLGYGRGSFSTIFQQYAPSDLRFEFAENLLLHWAIEWGWPATTLFTTAMGTLLLRLRRQLITLERTAVLLGVVALGAQNLVDFSLEILGVQVVVAAALGTAIAPPRPHTKQQPDRFRRGLSLCAACTLAGLTVLCAWSAPARDMQAAMNRVTDALGHHKPKRALSPHLRSALRQHPAEATLMSLAAHERTMAGDPTALRWLNRTMELVPHWHQPQLTASYALARRGHLQQATVHLRKVALSRPDLAARTFCRLGFARATPSLAQQVAPPRGQRRVHFYQRIFLCPNSTDPWRRALEDRLMRDTPPLPLAALRHAGRLLAGGGPQEASAVLTRLAALPQRTLDWRHEDRLERHLLSAQAHQVLGHQHAVHKALTRAWRMAHTHNDLAKVHRTTADLAAKSGDMERMHATLSKLRRLYGGAPEALARVEAFRGRLEERHGHGIRALAAYREAQRLNPSKAYRQHIDRLTTLLQKDKRPPRALP